MIPNISFKQGNGVDRRILTQFDDFCFVCIRMKVVLPIHFLEVYLPHDLISALVAVEERTGIISGDLGGIIINMISTS